MIEGFCVPPDHVPEIWPHASDFIRAAMAVGLTDFATTERKVFAGEMLLWIAWDGTAIRAAVITQLTIERNDKIGTIVACGGSGLEEFINLRSRLEDFFRVEGCKVSRILGRTGWARLLKDYRTKSIVLEKEL